MRRLPLLAAVLLVAAACGDAAEVTTTPPAATSRATAATTTPATTPAAATSVATTTTLHVATTTSAPPSTTTTTAPPSTATTSGAPSCADLGAGSLAEVAVFGIPTGTQRWSAGLGAPLAEFAVAGDTVLLVLGDGSLVALEAATCRERWRTPIGADVALTAADGVVYAATPDVISARDVASGAPLWSTAVEPIAPGSGPIVAGGLVMIVDEGSRIVALDAVTGGVVFEIDLPGAGRAATGDGLLFATGTMPSLLAFELATGFPAWSAPLGAAGIEPTYHGGGVFVSLEDGDVAALDATSGELRWSVSIGGTPVGPPMIDHNEVHQLDDAGRLHHLERATGKSVFVGTFDSDTVPAPADRLVIEPQPGAVVASNLLERERWRLAVDQDAVIEVRIGDGFVVAHAVEAG